MDVKDLLNPAPEENERPEEATITSRERPALVASQTELPSMQKSCKPKLAKDAPIFRKGPIKGEVLFPPHEAGDDKELADQYERFRIYPRGEIAEYCNHIPYSSDKKTFLTKTGRDAFEGNRSSASANKVATDSDISVPIHIQVALRRSRIRCDVGL